MLKFLNCAWTVACAKRDAGEFQREALLLRRDCAPLEERIARFIPLPGSCESHPLLERVIGVAGESGGAYPQRDEQTNHGIRWGAAISIQFPVLCHSAPNVSAFMDILARRAGS